MKKLLMSMCLGSMCLVGNSVWGASVSTMQDFVERYCDEQHPIDDCGIYDREIADAQIQAKRIKNIITRYDATKTHIIVRHLLQEFSDTFDETYNISDKLLAAYYYDYFSRSFEDDIYDVNSLISGLFSSSKKKTYDNSQDYYYTDKDDYYYSQNNADGGEITSVAGINSRTSVSSKTIRITSDVLDIAIKAEDDRGRLITSTDEYRLVVKTDDSRDRTYAATYTSSGQRRLRLANNFSSTDEITLYLLCKDCRTGTRFRSDSILDGWRIIDQQTYDISTSSNYYDDDRYGYTNDDYDLSLSRLEYTYDVGNRETHVRLTTTVSNEGRRDVTLNNLEYNINVRGDRYSSRDYDIDHIRTRCDDNSVSSSRDRNLLIAYRDECEIIVEFTFDADDVEDEIMDIEVRLRADRDGNSGNDYKSVRFRVSD